MTPVLETLPLPLMDTATASPEIAEMPPLFMTVPPAPRPIPISP
jgi:hypothetical protein